MYELLRNFLMGLGSRRLKDIKGNELSLSPISPVHKTALGLDKMDLMMGVPLSIKKSHKSGFRSISSSIAMHG